MNKEKLYSLAFKLSLFTIGYNIIEGLVCIYFGIRDETITLFGFGADSFIETISAIGVSHMIFRIKKNGSDKRDDFEKTALKITGYSFYALSILLILTVINSIYNHEKPVTTKYGILISIISIVIMLITIKWKTKIGKELNSASIIADANCAKICVYMSIVLLLSSVIYEFTHFAYSDIIGTLGIIYFSIREGKECFDKIKSGEHCNCKH